MTLDILVKYVAVWGNEGLCDLEMAGGRFVSIGLDTTSPKAASGHAERRGPNGRSRICRTTYSSG
jgi:hypothetical protein